MKSYQIVCPKCNNFQNFYRYGKDNLGYQKYQCRCCNHQFAPDRPSVARDGEVQTGGRRRRSYPSCPRCGKASFIHHNYDYYTNYRCCDKKCNHSFFVVKGNAVAESSMSKLFGKTNFKRISYLKNPNKIILTQFDINTLKLYHVYLETSTKTFWLCKAIFFQNF